MRKIVLSCVILLRICVATFAQESESQPADAYSRGQVVFNTGLSLLPAMIEDIAFLLPPLGTDTDSNLKDKWYLAPISTLNHLPIYAYDWKKGLLFSGATALGLGLYCATAFADVSDDLRAYAFIASYQINQYGSYEVYGHYRTRSEDPMYRRYRSYSFGEIAGAAFNPDVLLHPFTLIVSPLLIVGTVAPKFFRPQPSAVWTTGEAWFFTQKMPLAAALAIRAGIFMATMEINCFEESFWRGLVYEELKYTFDNPIAACIVSSALWALWHYPLQGGGPAEYAVIASTGLLLTWAYELGGVPLAGVGHGLYNAVTGIVTWCFIGGKAHKSVAEAVNPLTAQRNSVAASTGSTKITLFSYSF